MVDSRQKGGRAEAAAKKLLIDKTGLDWQRTPGSGALNAAHKLKGDLYIPDEKNKFCVEVKHYKDDHLTSKVLTDKTPQIIKWWEQAWRQASQVGQIPLLLFKFDRSKWFVACEGHAFEPDIMPVADKYRYIKYTWSSDYHPIYIAKLEDWLDNEDIEWIF